MDFDPYTLNWKPHVPQLMLIETCWELTSPRGRLLSCGVYRTDAGLEIRAGYGNDLIRSQYAARIGTARDVAGAWKTAALEKGFSELTN